MIFNYISKYKQKAHKEVKVIKSRCEVEKLKSDRVSFVLEAMSPSGKNNGHGHKPFFFSLDFKSQKKLAEYRSSLHRKIST